MVGVLSPVNHLGWWGWWEETGCELICGAPTTLAVKGKLMMMMTMILMMMMMMMTMMRNHLGLYGG